MSTATERAITELRLSEDLIAAAVANLSDHLVSGARVEAVKARDALARGLSGIQEAIAEIELPPEGHGARVA
jgi:hypothetical protein